MDITVVVCTYDRCQTLARALNSLMHSELPQGVQWEVLVVDNNSKDKTREIVAGFCEQRPECFRYLFEQQPGLSCARNAGIREARGSIIVFTDDDVTVDPMWLWNLTASLNDPRWAGVGGRVVPEWSCPPPPWLIADKWYTLGPLPNFDFGPSACELARPPFGANMGFRKTMFEKYGYFRTDLGRRPLSLMSNEDTEFAGRLLVAGEHLRYEPSAVVFHPVQKERMQKEYFLAWWLNKGQANIRQFGVKPGTKYRIAGVPLYLLCRFAKWGIKWMVSIDPIERFSNKLSACENLGEIRECFRESPAPKKEKGVAALDPH